MKNNNMRHLIILLILTSLRLVVYAQTISYSYDDAGNRINRTIVMENRSATIPDTTQIAAAPDLEEQEEAKETPYMDILGEQEIKVFPNPTKGDLRVTFNYLQPEIPTKLTVYNVAGSQLINLENLSNSNRVDLSSQKPGIYLMRIFVGEKSFEWKIIKR